MGAPRRLTVSMRRTRGLFAPKIYYFHPILAGPRATWPAHLRRCRDLNFDHVLSAPLFAPGEASDLFLTADHDRVHPAVEKSLSLRQVIEELVHVCTANGLQLFMDAVPGYVAADAAIVKAFPDWFHSADPATGPIDPRSSRRLSGAAYARFDEIQVANELADWWIERLLRLIEWGITGFRCESPQLLPPAIWRKIIAAVKHRSADCRFLAWTPGLDWSAIARLRGVGFDAAFSSVAWWDGRASWIVEEHELLRGIGSVIGCAEAPYGPRLARRLQDSSNRRGAYRHLLRRTAAISHGTMTPMGVEFAATADMKRQGGDEERLAAPENCSTGLAVEIRDANALTSKLASLGLDGEIRKISDTGSAVTALLRSDVVEARFGTSSAVVLINTELRNENPLPISLDPLPSTAGTAATARGTILADHEGNAALGAGEIRLISALPTAPIKRRIDMQTVKAAVLSRIVIDNVTPTIDTGRFAAKRIVGDSITVSADVFTDGHEVIAVELLWRAADEKEWRRSTMALLNNDRWEAAFTPDRIGRYEFTIDAWWDRYGTFCRDLKLKRDAGANLGVEIIEGRQILEQASTRTQDGETNVIASAIAWLSDAGVEVASDILLAQDLREVMRETEERHFLCRREPPFAIEVERPQAGFSAWYELFPRSATDDARRHGTFDDVVGRLPAIRDMGFDVLYLPPIHPIGTTNRKGKNNSLDVEPGDVGSPYAIGNREGGHDTIHPALGTIKDFRRLRDAAAAHGMEIALDFAIQCSPDHPWLEQHPEWFNWRPDGTVRYAENPPKKYQDIVNLDFYCPGSYPALWNALRDVALFWCDEGVRIFRVDNPHTKPLPFWEWLIAQLRGRYPDIVLLSEAFTRPKMMYRLAKLGFTQSYTYFTWRNSKRELTEYFTELTTSEAKDFFRPHLFVNTPDINPYFLQTSGRPGFLIRAALAATLSGLWGMYSGFELCEAAPLPGREEYLNSEKYEIRVRNHDAPGNITAEITRLNRIRKNHSALYSHLGLRFYPAHHDQVLFYGKLSADRAEMILVAVNLDPFHAHEATIEVPTWEFGLPDDATVPVDDLMRDAAFAWHGKLQRIRLDPAELPFAIWRVTPPVGG
jgi:starch synthase (maltosyl-transferring)